MAMAYNDGVNRRFLQLVDGAVADNLGMRDLPDSFEILEALYLSGRPTPLDSARRIVVFGVNSMITPKANWEESEESPDSVSTLKDIASRLRRDARS